MIYGKENGLLCSRTLSVTSINPIVHGSAASWRGRVNAGCRVKSCDSVRFLSGGGSIEWAQQSAVAFAEAAAREFHGSAFAGVPASPDLQWLRDCTEFVVQRKS